MSRFANWFKKTVDIKTQGPFAVLVPTFSAATVENEAGETEQIPSATFIQCTDNDQPRIIHRQTLRQQGKLAKALEKVWEHLPRYLLFIPIKHQSGFIVSLLGRRESPKPEHLQEFIDAFTERAIDSLSLPDSAFEEVAVAINTDEVVVVSTLNGRPLALSPAARDFFQVSHCQHLEKLLGTKITDTISEKYETLTLTGQITAQASIRDANREYWKADVRIIMNEATIMIELKSLNRDELRQRGGVTRVGIQSLASETSKPIPRTTRLKRTTGELVCWLECEPLDPIPLGPQPIVTIGRSDQNDLVLPHKSVSRNHATIKVVGNTVILEDHGSANGVLVNGERRERHTLNIGDRIVIGPYELGLRDAADEPIKDAGETTVRHHVSFLDRGTALAGDVKETPLAELLQSLEFNQKTGTLTIYDGSHHAFICVKSGRTFSAQFDDLRDLDAVLKILTLKEGQFTFSNQEPPEPRTMTDTITSILLEASRRIDENSGSNS